MAQFEVDGSVLKKCKLDRGEKEVVIPEGVTKIAAAAFKACAKIVKITFPETLTEIGDQAFWKCSSLETCIIPDGVVHIGSYAFGKCTSLKEIKLPENNTQVLSKAFCQCTGLTSVQIPGAWDTVPNTMFEGCINLSQVVISEGVKEMKGLVFKDCTALTEITLPESLEEICGGEFDGTAIRYIRIPANVKRISYDTFYGCEELKEIEFAACPQADTELRKDLEKMLKTYPELVDKIRFADEIPPDLASYMDWIRNGAAYPRDIDREWPQEIIKRLKYDDYILIFNTNMCIDMTLYHVIGNEYVSSRDETYNSGSGRSLYKEWEEYFEWMMENDKALRAYHYVNGKLAEIRELDQKLYNSWVYADCLDEVILRNEFGLEPQSEEWKAEFAVSLAKAEKFRKTLVYACYADDRPAILERAAKASKTALNQKFEYFGTPLTFCAEHDFLEGFKLIAERGGDLTKQIVAGTVCPIRKAMLHSPEITLYIAENHPEAFDAHYKNWEYGIVITDDTRVWDILFERWGSTGMEKLFFTYLLNEENVNIKMIKYMIDHGADYLNYVDRDYKCNALIFAQRQYEKYGDDSHKEAWELMKAE